MKSVVTNTIEETSTLASSFIRREIKGKKIICLMGELGAGKTTFAQGILSAFNAEGPYTSPTFNIIKEYDVDKNGIKKIYHIDAYRIGSDDMELIGWKDIIADENALTIIEWPENVRDILPEDVLVISCEVVGRDKRKYNFNGVIARRHRGAIS